MFFKNKVQYCAGEVCDIKTKDEIQKVSWSQVFIVIVFAAFIIASAYVFKEHIGEAPFDLFGLEK